MARGRKPNNPQHAFLKNPPPHIVARATSPAGKKKLAESKKMIKAHSDQWRELRRQGVTIDLFEMQEIVDPELMGSANALTYKAAEAIPKYANAIDKVNAAKYRNIGIARAGGEAMQENTRLFREKLQEKFPEIIKKLAERKCSAVHAATTIINQWAGKPWDLLGWSGDERGPSLGTLRKHLKKLVKATNQ